jgi:hypothetical protein
MKKAQGQSNGDATCKTIRIAVTAGDDVSWSAGFKHVGTSPARPIPGSLVTKILCERDVQLRLTRFLPPREEKLGFCVA